VIREIEISTASTAGEDFHEPPSGVLKLCVVGDEALLTWVPLDWPVGTAVDGEDAEEIVPPMLCEFRVSARSLMLALRVAWEDGHPEAPL
jgi:hypothetical protein